MDPKARYGLKKPGLADIPPSALIELGRAMRNGAGKYGRMNWRENSVRADVYYDAAMRHLLRWWDGEDLDRDSGLPHLAHAMASLAILIDAAHARTMHDNRPVPGVASQLIDDATENVKGDASDADAALDAETDREGDTNDIADILEGFKSWKV